MGKIKIHAGDFPEGKDSQFINGTFLLATGGKSMLGVPKWEKIKPDSVAELEKATEDAVKRIGGTVGWGVAGAVLLGPVGLLAGLLAGGRGKDVTFVAQLRDGRRLLATTDAKTYTQMQAAMF